MAHLVLDYNLLLSSFQAPKCVIKVKDSLLYQINVATLSFLNPSPTPKGVLEVTLPPQYTVEEPTPSQPTIKEEEEEEIVEVSDSRDNFKVFN